MFHSTFNSQYKIKKGIADCVNNWHLHVDLGRERELLAFLNGMQVHFRL